MKSYYQLPILIKAPSTKVIRVARAVKSNQVSQTRLHTSSSLIRTNGERCKGNALIVLLLSSHKFLCTPTNAGALDAEG